MRAQWKGKKQRKRLKMTDDVKRLGYKITKEQIR